MGFGYRLNKKAFTFRFYFLGEKPSIMWAVAEPIQLLEWIWELLWYKTNKSYTQYTDCIILY